MFGALAAGAQTKPVKAAREDFRSPFRYVIVNERVEPSLGGNDEPRRFVEILLDAKKFSKENLTALFKLVAERYPKPELLFVQVYTSLEDIDTPEEADLGKTSGGGNSAAPNLSDSAVFTRSRERSFYYMNFADGKTEEVKIK